MVRSLPEAAAERLLIPNFFRRGVFECSRPLPLSYQATRRVFRSGDLPGTPNRYPSTFNARTRGKSDHLGSRYWARGYVYLGGQLLAIRSGGVKWVPLDTVVKSQWLTDNADALQAVLELDAWGGKTGSQPFNSSH